TDDALVGECNQPETALLNPIMVAVCGKPQQTLKAAEETNARASSTSWRSLTYPLLRAASELRAGKPEQAIDILKPLSPYEVWSPAVTYLRGLAYLRGGKGMESAAEFQRILDHKGLHWRIAAAISGDTGPLRPVSFVGLARAAALAGDTAKAKTTYQDFLALWKDADEDIPILIEAKKEYAALK